MGRKRFVLALVATAALLAVRPTAPVPAAADRRMEETLERLKVFFAAVERIQDEYVDTGVLDPPDTMVRGAIEGMIKALGDPYSHYLPPEPLRDLQQETQGEFGGIGILIGVERERLTVVSPIEGTPADRAGLRAGDVIAEIEGEATEGMPLQTAVSKLRGPVGTSVKVVVVRSGEALPPITLQREKIPIHSAKWAMLPDGIGVVRLSQFTNQTADELDEALRALQGQGMRGLILDLRHNPGGVLQAAVAVADRFIDTGLVVYTRGRTREQNQDFPATVQVTTPRTPMVVLVDEGSASASEIVAGAIQDVGRGVLVGTKTFGKGSVQSVRTLPDGSGIALTTALYYTPNGRRIHGTGLQPDVVVQGRTPPEGEVLEALQKDEFREILNDFSQGRAAYTDTDLHDLSGRLRAKEIEIPADLLEFLVLRELTRRRDQALYLKPELDPQLKAAVDLLKANTILARP